jgi:ribonuclease D
MSFVLIDEPGKAAGIGAALRSERRIALDCEAAGFHRYSDRLCLVQLSTPSRDYILDPLRFDPSPLLRPILEDPGVEVVVHGADYDVRLLDRDLDIQPNRLFDTQAAAALLGEPSLGLAGLLERHLGIMLSKKYQRADWAARPLPDDMLEYAASDTRHLFQLADILQQRLVELGRLEWAREEFLQVEGARWEEDGEEDPVVRVRGARDLPPRQLAALREALAWRDRLARERDRAPFRVVGDPALVEAVRTRPRTVEELARLPGMSPGLARSEGPALLTLFDEVEALPAAELPGYPRRATNGRGRPPPDIEELAERLKEVRNRRAEALGIDRGTLLANSVLMEVAWERPGTVEALRAVPGMKAWQAEAVGRELVEVLRR